MRSTALGSILALSACTTLAGIDEDYVLRDDATGGASSGATGGAAGSGASGGSGGAAGSGGIAGAAATGGTGGTGATGGTGGMAGASGTGASGGVAGAGATGGMAGASGTGATGGTGGTSGCPTISGPFPSTAVLDNFNRADGGLGPSWDSDNKLQITNEEVTVTAGSSPFAQYGTIGCADQEVFVKVVTPDPTATELFIHAKGQTLKSDCPTIELVYSAGAFSIWTCVLNGTTHTWSQQSTDLSMTIPQGAVVGMRVLKDGNVTAYVNGTQLFAVDLAGKWPFYASPGYLGFGYVKSTGIGVLDDFGGG